MRGLKPVSTLPTSEVLPPSLLQLWLQHTLAENYMGRFKGIIGPKLRGRKIESQKVEAMIGCAILNRMAALGTPTTLTENG